MERFFEMAAVLYVMTLVINVGLAGAFVGGGLQVNEIQFSDTNGTVLDYNGLQQQMDIIFGATSDYSDDANTLVAENEAVTGFFFLPSTIFAGLLAGILGLLTIVSIFVTTPVLWFDLMTGLGNIIDSGHGAIFQIFLLFAILITAINFFGLAFITLKIASLVRGVLTG